MNVAIISILELELGAQCVVEVDKQQTIIHQPTTLDKMESLNEKNIKKEKIRISYFYLYFSILEKKILGKYPMLDSLDVLHNLSKGPKLSLYECLEINKLKKSSLLLNDQNTLYLSFYLVCFRKQPKTFAFDHCFCSIDPANENFASQEVVFDCLGRDILDNAFQGYNACIFAYGQTVCDGYTGYWLMIILLKTRREKGLREGKKDSGSVTIPYENTFLSLSICKEKPQATDKKMPHKEKKGENIRWIDRHNKTSITRTCMFVDYACALAPSRQFPRILTFSLYVLSILNTKIDISISVNYLSKSTIGYLTYPRRNACYNYS
ncbi:hypothetical protein NQ317_003091 [Molorchus minor]|uniref:Kinesin motor domain-containing protein n=1 Tax=Molorchus minor TaxID=1323400 RepID=A0ABQ9ISU2_9CUCU|nr:hypothetical protein NQ317_003091 [Molorchus minor]